MNNKIGTLFKGCIVIFLAIVFGFFSGLGGVFVGIRVFNLGDGPNVIEQTQVIEELNAVTTAYDKVNAAVVNIIITKDLPKYEQYYTNPFGDEDSSFKIPQYRQDGTEQRQIGAGSGFVVSADGYIVTNRHVVSAEDASYTVIFSNGEKIDAKVLARDTLLDIAILKVEKSGLSFVEFGDSDKIEIGQRVIAIGNALGEFQNSVSDGIISGLGRSIVAGSSSGGQTEQLENIIQTDASINPGNSGGPLLNYNGLVIGVNVAVAQSAENIGFAIPINEVKKVVESVIQHGEIRRPYLGVRYISINETIAKQNNLSVNYGALIVKGDQASELAIIPGSPADKAGLKENDIILEIGGKKVETSLQRMLQNYSIGDTVTLKILRQGQEQTVELTLEALKQTN